MSNTPDPQQLSEDELIESVAREMEARRADPASAGEPKEPAQAQAQAPAAEAQPPTLGEVQPAAPAADAPPPEPFPGYSELSEEVRKHYDRLRADLDKVRQDYGAIHNRLAPTQRELDRERRARQELQQALQSAKAPPAAGPAQPASAAPAPAPAPAADLRGEVERWLQRQSPERQEYFKQFPEEAMTAFEIAHGVVKDVLSQREEEFKRQLKTLEERTEFAQLSAMHPDFSRYMLADHPTDPTKAIAPTQEAADFWSWVNRQPEHIYALANSARAVDISSALSLFKWEKENPEFGQTVSMPEFNRWAAVMPRRLIEMLGSTDVGERQFVLAQFWRDYEEATKGGQPGAQPAAGGPEASKAADLAAKRAQQAQRTAPSVRSTPTPAASGAGASEDAEIESAWQMREAWRRRANR